MHSSRNLSAMCARLLWTSEKLLHITAGVSSHARFRYCQLELASDSHALTLCSTVSPKQEPLNRMALLTPRNESLRFLYDITDFALQCLVGIYLLRLKTFLDASLL